MSVNGVFICTFVLCVCVGGGGFVCVCTFTQHTLTPVQGAQAALSISF